MYDIKELEKEWREYNRRKRRPWYLLIALVFLILILAQLSYQYHFFDFKHDTNNALVNKKIKNTKVDSIVLLDGKISKLLVEPSDTIETQNIKDELFKGKEKSHLPTLPIVNNIPIIDKVPVGKIIVTDKPKITIKTKPMIEVKDKPRKKMHLDIVESSSVSAYSDVEKRFYQSHDTDDSLFLAKSYYRKGNYRKAEYWAFQTNKVNNSIEESWLIYVKAKSKLGHKNEAIRILTHYAKRSNSSAAWNLLLKLKK